MTQSSIREYVEAVRQRYFLASKKEKGKMLDEFTQVTGLHRKAAILLIGHSAHSKAGKKGGRPRQYGAAVVAALRLARDLLPEAGAVGLFLLLQSGW